jgi:hypothetical protein
LAAGAGQFIEVLPIRADPQAQGLQSHSVDLTVVQVADFAIFVLKNKGSRLCVSSIWVEIEVEFAEAMQAAAGTARLTEEIHGNSKIMDELAYEIFSSDRSVAVYGCPRQTKYLPDEQHLGLDCRHVDVCSGVVGETEFVVGVIEGSVCQTAVSPVVYCAVVYVSLACHPLVELDRLRSVSLVLEVELRRVFEEDKVSLVDVALGEGHQFKVAAVLSKHNHCEGQEGDARFGTHRLDVKHCSRCGRPQQFGPVAEDAVGSRLEVVEAQGCGVDAREGVSPGEREVVPP